MANQSGLNAKSNKTAKYVLVDIVRMHGKYYDTLTFPSANLTLFS